MESLDRQVEQIVETLKIRYGYHGAVIDDGYRLLKDKLVLLDKERNETFNSFGKQIEQLPEGVNKKDYINSYYIARVLSLGCLGAMLTLLVVSVVGRGRDQQSDSTPATIFTEKNFYQRLTIDCLAGALVAVVIFSLLHTKQITVFEPSAAANMEVKGEVDHWRLTFVCLIAGAFARKIYLGAADVIDKRIKETK